MNGNMEGKAARVTGASGGIGLATARRFARAGAGVALCARRAELIDEEVERLTAAGFGSGIDSFDTANVYGRGGAESG